MSSEGVRRSFPVDLSFRDLPSRQAIPDGVEALAADGGSDEISHLRFEVGLNVMIQVEEDRRMIILLVDPRCAKKVLRLMRPYGQSIIVPKGNMTRCIGLRFQRPQKMTVKEEFGSPTRTIICVPVSAVRDYLSDVERGAI